ncbi:MAG: LysR family transcriptional regulator [bacterium]|nr:LysR family transcriptional regulator [bacterium]
MMPSPADLSYFAEVATTLNVSRAAERLGISQPSLSLAMQRLEDSVGVGLLVRSKRGVTLTPAGKQLLAHAKQLMQAWDDVKAGALASQNDIQGSYSIGCHPSMGMNLLAHIIPTLMKQHPKLDFRLRHDISRKVAEDVVSMKTDIGIVVNPVQHPDLVIHHLASDEVTLWTKEKARDLPDVLICDPELLQTQGIMKKLKKAGISFSRTLTCSSLEVIGDLTAHGGGTGIIPARVAARAKQKLQRVDKAPVFHDEHCLIYRVENKNIKTMQAINGAIRAFFAA